MSLSKCTDLCQTEGGNNKNEQSHAVSVCKMSIYNLSRHMTEVMADIGVTEEIVSARRKTWFDIETMETFAEKLQKRNNVIFHFGSQSEGTTTAGLNSDVDKLFRFDISTKVNLIGKLKEWNRCEEKTLLVSETPSDTPGYRCLVPLSQDKPVPLSEIPSTDGHEFKFYQGVLYLLNSHLHAYIIGDGVIHGAANTVKGTGPFNPDKDFVPTYYFQQWPHEANQWIERTERKPWPTSQLKEKIVKSGCFIVAVGHKQSKEPDIEYRLSTSKAERMLMFSLNITQVTCLVLLKMLVKSHINSKHADCMKTFYCKTALLYMIEDSDNKGWTDKHILSCVQKCLAWLNIRIAKNNIPHYFMPSLNMLEGRLDESTRRSVGTIINNLKENIAHALLKIVIDSVGQRLKQKCWHRPSNVTFSGTKSDTAVFLWNSFSEMQYRCLYLMKTELGSHDIASQSMLLRELLSECNNQSGTDLNVVNNFKPFISSALGVLQASQAIEECNDDTEDIILSDETYDLLGKGLENASPYCKLRFASVLYCCRKYIPAEKILTDVEAYFDREGVAIVCQCSNNFVICNKTIFDRDCIERINNGSMHNRCTCCVVFTRSEIKCVPDELKYEMFRHTEEASGHAQGWMEWACIDCIPFLYFLRYKIFKKLNKPLDVQTQAVKKLVALVSDKKVLRLYHMETAFNLLGQCEEENSFRRLAYSYYRMSLNVRHINNAAFKHIERLNARIVAVWLADSEKQCTSRTLYNRLS